MSADAKSKTIRATISFTAFIIIAMLLQDAFMGQPVAPVRHLVTATVAAVVYGTLLYLWLRRRPTPPNHDTSNAYR
jgi:hypothetical protein